MIDIAIIGAGPSGLTAAIYGVRAGLKTVVFEKNFAGGQMNYTSEVENFPGFVKISGNELAVLMEKQAKELGSEFVNAEIKAVKKSENGFILETSKESYEAENVILALGASPQKLGLESEEKLRGCGVSYCATCDGNFYKGGTVAVVGGGNTAFEDVEYLSKLCNKVFLIHRRSEFRADKILQEKIFGISNIEVITDSVIEEIEGKFEVTGIKIKNLKTNNANTIEVSGVFVAVGTKPNTECVRDLVETNEKGYIVTDEYMQTSQKGIFAIGDARDTNLRQIVTACSDGAMAVQGILKGNA